MNLSFEKISTKIMLVHSKSLTLTAVGLWFISLCLPVFGSLPQFADNNNYGQGLYILLIGWLAIPFHLNFAWLANVFFWAGISLRPRSYAYSLLAVLFSFDTLRFTEYLANEGGSTRSIIRYGWGFVFWGLAIFLLFWANEKYKFESQLENEEEEARGLERTHFGLLLFISLSSISIIWAVSDRVNSSANELKSLENYAFKKGKICRLTPNEFTMSIAPENQLGPLEIVIEHGTKNYVRGGIADPRKLLRFGVPWVRYRDDFHLSKDSNTVVVSSADNTPPYAKLLVSDIHAIEGNYVEVSLIETASNLSIFKQRWNFSKYSKACPDYYIQSSGKELNIPIQILFKALSIPIEVYNNSNDTITTLNTSNVDIQFSMYHEKFEKRITAVMHTGERKSQTELRDYFVINSKKYIDRSDLKNLLIKNGRLFQYNIYNSGKGKLVNINIREIHPGSFATKWSASIKLPDEHNAINLQQLVVGSISENNGVLSTSLVDVVTMQNVEVKATIEFNNMRLIDPSFEVNLETSDVSVQEISELIIKRRAAFDAWKAMKNKDKCQNSRYLQRRQLELKLKKNKGEKLNKWEKSTLEKNIEPNPESKFCKKYLSPVKSDRSY